MIDRRTAARAVVGILALVGSIAACSTDSPLTLPRFATLAALTGPWSPTPYELESALVTKIELACRDFVESTGHELGPGFQLAVIDARGEGVVNAWFADAAGPFLWCTDVPILATGAIGELRNFGAGGGDVPFDEVDPDEIWVAGQSFDREPPIRRWMIGYAGAEIVRIEWPSQAGLPVEATLDDGWWAVWEPGEMERGHEIKGYAADGSKVADVPATMSY